MRNPIRDSCALMETLIGRALSFGGKHVAAVIAIVVVGGVVKHASDKIVQLYELKLKDRQHLREMELKQRELDLKAEKKGQSK